MLMLAVVPLALQALPAILLVTAMFFNHESPRYLAKEDNWDLAKATLSQIRNLAPTHPYVEAELADIAEQLKQEREMVGGAGTKGLLKEMWTISGNRKRAFISIGLMICQQMTGTNAINYYAPQIFENLGLKGRSTSLFATGVYGLVKMAACLVFLIFVADSLGRRKSLLWTGIAQGCAMFYIGLYVRIDPPQAGQPVPPAGYFALVCIFLYVTFFQFGWGPVCWIYVSEIAAARLRGLNVAFAAATQWLFNFVVARATPNMLASMGRGGYGYVSILLLAYNLLIQFVEHF
jgi:Sugar (and other) transporter